MSPLAESVEFKPEPEPPLGEEIGDGSQAEAGADAPAEADDPFDPGLAPGVDPGVTLVGRTVQESDVYDTSGELEVRGRVGTVAGTRPHEHLGRVYDVTYSDGKDREVVLEELLLVLWRDESLVSSEIKSARERARAEASPGVGFVGAWPEKRATRKVLRRENRRRSSERETVVLRIRLRDAHGDSDVRHALQQTRGRGGGVRLARAAPAPRRDADAEAE
jgi:hypothetical protein